VSAISPKPYTLRNTIQHYAWGAQNGSAFIPKLLGVPAEPGVPYAEMWMGAHPTAPSSVVTESGRVPLDAWIARNPEAILGQAVASRFDAKLPFLLKVLSIGHPLSIQAHPSKAQAEALHARDPEHYPDNNHKPEIAIALEGLTALVGVKPLSELVKTLRTYPEIAAFIGADTTARVTDAVGLGSAEADVRVRRIFSALIERARAEPQALSETIATLDQRFNRPHRAAGEIERLFVDLAVEYPDGDLGLLILFLLNLVHLEPGQAVYTPAGVPHVHLSGSVVECMAASDNVVRAGLTPKFKDSETLLEIMDARPRPVAITSSDPEAEETIYTTPAVEFEVTRWRLQRGKQYRQVTNERPSILLATAHKVLLSWPTGTRYLKQGQSVLIPASVPWYTLTSQLSAEVFRATVPL